MNEKTRIAPFIIVHTSQRKGIRVNLEDISEYAKAGQQASDVQVICKNGRASVYRFATEKEAIEFMGVLDGYFL